MGNIFKRGHLALGNHSKYFNNSKNRNILQMAAKVYEFEVAMTCEGCSNAVKKVLDKHGQEKGIVGHEIDLANKKVRVTSNTLDNKEVEDILKKTGLSTSFVGVKEA